MDWCKVRLPLLRSRNAAWTGHHCIGIPVLAKLHIGPDCVAKRFFGRSTGGGRWVLRQRTPWRDLPHDLRRSSRCAMRRPKAERPNRRIPAYESHVSAVSVNPGALVANSMRDGYGDDA